ncbi:hypothetical protein DPMN_155929 [Dreissena polymorpha]|uniref:Uncharacterized protein n=1 Tax=Dreissena polymorpha TaxID=45954 RepID=A0A9D4FSM6_DREPO|nr:hypothetical protein DPMN_155929 [Dreissena polymorpha]
MLSMIFIHLLDAILAIDQSQDVLQMARKLRRRIWKGLKCGSIGIAVNRIEICRIGIEIESAALNLIFEASNRIVTTLSMSTVILNIY